MRSLPEIKKDLAEVQWVLQDHRPGVITRLLRDLDEMIKDKEVDEQQDS